MTHPWLICPTIKRRFPTAICQFTRENPIRIPVHPVPQGTAQGALKLDNYTFSKARRKSAAVMLVVFLWTTLTSEKLEIGYRLTTFFFRMSGLLLNMILVYFGEIFYQMWHFHHSRFPWPRWQVTSLPGWSFFVKWGFEDPGIFDRPTAGNSWTVRSFPAFWCLVRAFMMI